MELAKLVGELVDVVPFGEVRCWTGGNAHEIEHQAVKPQDGVYIPVDMPEQGGKHIGVEWDVPRQFYSVVVRYAGKTPDPARVKFQYWVHNWPAKWSGGWTHIDDPYNGHWTTVRGDAKVEGNKVTYTFDPLDFTEIRHADDFAVFYRQSYRFRLLFKPDVNVKIEGFEAYSSSTWQAGEVKIEFDGNAKYDGKLSIRSGYILSEKVKDGVVTARVLYTDCSKQVDPRILPVPPDQTVITVKAKPQDFSFLVTDALSAPVVIPDLGVTVSDARAKNHVPPAGPKPIFDRILDEPEQSYERASKEIPQLVKIRQGRYVPLGCDANRQEFALRFNGNVFIDKGDMKVSGRDTAKLLFPGRRIDYKFPTMDPPDFREREDATKQSAMNGYLPIFKSEWKDREIYFEKTDFSALLMESPWEEEKKRGDEPTCLFSRIKIRNTTEDRLTARFWFIVENPEVLTYEDGFVYAIGRIAEDYVPYHMEAIEKRWVNKPYDQPRMRAHIETFGRGIVTPAACTYEPLNVTGLPNATMYEITLEPRESHTIEMKVPFITFIGSDGRDAVKSASYDAKLQEMVEYWESMINAGANIEVPDIHITEFTKATIPHIAITADKDIDTGYYLLPAGTYSYNVCANEAMHQVRSLDLRGHHEQARKYLTPYVDLQGTRPLHGKFKTQQGVLHGLRVNDEVDYQTFNYNLDHGFVLFSLCEHYLLTRDKKWGSKIAQNLVDACDFVTRERKYTMTKNANGQKSPEYGLIPPGHLEDNPEWLYWYAVNAYCYRGMEASAYVLKDLGHPEAEKITKDTEAYRQDLRRSMKLHMERSPVTKLSDGAYVPFTPTRAQLYSRDVGWIRDSLYGPIHSIECGVLDPTEDQSTWILKDSEDNVFVSRWRGRQVDLDNYWFSQGGNTIQSGLLPMVMVYVKRDQPEHAIRCLYNALAQNLYADVRCFTEHPVAAFGLGAGPFYKTPDENCWINWLRHILLAERGYDELILAPATPRAWLEDGREIVAEGMATYFGPVSYRIESNVSNGEIKATIAPPKRNPPKTLILRLRHPDKKPIKSVTVNGEDYTGFNKKQETIQFKGDVGKKIVVVAKY